MKQVLRDENHASVCVVTTPCKEFAHYIVRLVHEIIDDDSRVSAPVKFGEGRQTLVELYTIHFVEYLLKHAVTVENSVWRRAYNSLCMFYQSLYKHAFTRACWTRYHAGERCLPDVMCHVSDDDDD